MPAFIFSLLAFPPKDFHPIFDFLSIFQESFFRCVNFTHVLILMILRNHLTIGFLIEKALQKTLISLLADLA